MMKNLYKLSKLYMATILINFMVLIITAQVHAETFSLIRDPISWLGRAETSAGESNSGALLLFSASLLLNAYIWKKVLEILAERRFWQYPFVKLMSYMVLSGFLLMALPCDIFIKTHSIGSGFVIGGLWALNTISLVYFKDHFENKVLLLMHFILHISALFCGANFVFNTALKGFSQRPLLAAIAFISGLCIKNRIHFEEEKGYEYDQPVLLRDH